MQPDAHGCDRVEKNDRHGFPPVVASSCLVRRHGGSEYVPDLIFCVSPIFRGIFQLIAALRFHPTYHLSTKPVILPIAAVVKSCIQSPCEIL
jgi:hypothetical protein